MADGNRISELRREVDRWIEMEKFFDQQAANCQKAEMEAKRWGGNGAEMYAAQLDYERQAAEASHKVSTRLREIDRLEGWGQPQ